MILDIYHRRFFETHQGVRRIEREGVEVAITNSLKGNRLTARLVYADGNPDDSFEWQLFTPEEIGSLASEFDLQCLLVCTEYDEHEPATLEKPRMQLVFERDF